MKNKITITILSLLTLLSLGIGTYFYLENKNLKSNNTQETNTREETPSDKTSIENNEETKQVIYFEEKPLEYKTKVKANYTQMIVPSSEEYFDNLNEDKNSESIDVEYGTEVKIINEAYENYDTSLINTSNEYSDDIMQKLYVRVKYNGKEGYILAEALENTDYVNMNNIDEFIKKYPEHDLNYIKTDDSYYVKANINSDTATYVHSGPGFVYSKKAVNINKYTKLHGIYYINRWVYIEEYNGWIFETTSANCNFPYEYTSDGEIETASFNNYKIKLLKNTKVREYSLKKDDEFNVDYIIYGDEGNFCVHAKNDTFEGMICTTSCDATDEGCSGKNLKLENAVFEVIE